MQQSIPEPLWDLMLSTNDCYPGCSCDADGFEIELERVGKWLTRVGIDHGWQALAQLDALSASLPANSAALSDLTNVYFGSSDEAASWLLQWRTVLSSALDAPRSAAAGHA